MNSPSSPLDKSTPVSKLVEDASSDDELSGIISPSSSIGQLLNYGETISDDSLIDISSSKYSPSPIAPRLRYPPTCVPLTLSVSSSSSFDEDIEEQAAILAGNDEKSPESFASKLWFDLSKSKPGLDGLITFRKLKQEGGAESSHKIFSELNEILTSISSEESIVSFFASALCLFQNARENPAILKLSEELCLNTIRTAASIIVPPLSRLVAEALLSDSATQKELFGKLKKTKSSFSASYSAFLFDRMVEGLDCTMANSVLTGKIFSRFSELAKANTSLTNLEAEVGITFPTLRQLFLVVLARDVIIADHATLATLMPLIPPIAAFVVLCRLKQDELMDAPLEYRDIEKFAKDSGCDFSTPAEDTLFVAPKVSLPLRTPEFDFPASD